ncbi:three-Cys-motif partner protein TcmP [candidate division TA06 bacterium]|uniref:Three-Cys-motif partner protein TcmP n=1 Tax=candidate division TA06 bacterium TaxID=2250710 RepID=A0A933ICI2_UNCT6|nr:three-Cys-motif partner protein TcmP [candidate division TA06 bacterium]
MEDDGLITPEVGIWAKGKYLLMQNYADIFTRSMKDKWDTLVYIDLFAGAGRSKIKSTGEIVESTPILAIKLSNKFSKYLFCDSDEAKLKALQKRVENGEHNIDASYIVGDVNMSTEAIIDNIPVPGKDNKVLTFCFTDPYKLDNLSFNTIEAIAKARRTDFLVLIPTDMDAKRNADTYKGPSNNNVEKFIGYSDWRDRWEKFKVPNANFGLFVLGEFSKHMGDLGYKQNEDHESVLVRNQQRKAPLYRLAFFSKHDLGKTFWKETKKYGNPQTNMFG